MKNTLLRTLALSALTIAFVAFTLLLPGCAALQKRNIDPDSWVQVDTSALTFTKTVVEGSVVFIKVVKIEETITVVILTTANSNTVIAASIIDEKSDGIVDQAFVVFGTYNDKVESDGFPFIAQGYPRNVGRQHFGLVTQDLVTSLELWKTAKHISLAEMNAIVMALSVVENDAVSLKPTWPESRGREI